MRYPESLFESLEHQGWAISDNLLPDDLFKLLTNECRQLWQAGQFHDAGIGHQNDRILNAGIRGDSTCWLDAASAELASRNFFAWAEGLRHELNRRFFLGLNSEEFHFARYALGRGYKKHLDQHRASQQRKISLVLYLNQQWQSDDGGELCLYSAETDAPEITRILPKPQRLVLFRSDLIVHQVLPGSRDRWSLAGWFRTDMA